ncbi:MAG: DHA2 family efflux MFS transporter permease subunit [bacterium]
MAAEHEQLSYGNWVLATALIGTFLTVLNSSMVNIALPTLMREFGLPLDVLTWLVTGYMLPYSVLMPICGRLGDLYGRRRLFLAGMLVFIAGACCAGFARSFVPLLLFRVIQAVGAAAILPNGMSLVNAVFPANQRGRVMGIWGGTAAFGAVIGPTVGGYLVQYTSWRAIFYVNIPVGLIGLLPAVLILREVKGEAGERRFDYMGAAALTVSMFALLLAVTQTRSYGLLSARIGALLAVFLVFFLAFLRTEKRFPQPMVDLSLFTNPTFTAATFGGFIQMFSVYAVTLLMPVFLQNVRGYTTANTGLFLVAYSLTQAAASPLGGWLADRFGKRPPAVAGLSISAAAFFLLSGINSATPEWSLLLRLAIGGLGIGIITSPLTSGVIEASPPAKTGVSSGLYNMIRFGGSVASAAVLGSLLQTRTARYAAALPAAGEAAALQRAFGEVYLLVAAVSLLGVLTVSRLRDKDRTAGTAVEETG